jgi:hypothetical protein
MDTNKLIDYFEDDCIQYIYFRINLINEHNTTININHVNCIIIDKKNKYVLIFEPKGILSYDINIIKNLFHKYDNLNQYKYLTPCDIGYKQYSTSQSLQRYDFYCQTYVMMVFYLIINNKNIKFSEYSKLFTKSINKKTVGYFLYQIDIALKKNNIEFHSFPILWSYQDGYIASVWRMYQNIYAYDINNDICDGTDEIKKIFK